jgi:addiction module HigA family antidote
MAMFAPAHPGELIKETIEGIREETGDKLTIEEVAKGLQVSRKTLSAIINQKQGISSEMALKLAKAFNTSPDFWLRAQENFNLALARRNINMDNVKVFWARGIAVM